MSMTMAMTKLQARIDGKTSLITAVMNSRKHSAIWRVATNVSRNIETTEWRNIPRTESPSTLEIICKPNDRWSDDDPPDSLGTFGEWDMPKVEDSIQKDMLVMVGRGVDS